MAGDHALNVDGDRTDDRFSRRWLLTGSLCVPVASAFPAGIRPAFGQTGAEILAAALALLGAAAQGFAEQYGRNIADQVKPPKFYGELTSRLNLISGQISKLTTLVIQLPDVIAVKVEELFKRDAQAAISAYKPTIDAILKSKPENLSANDIAQLNTAIVGLEIAIEKLWTYGMGVYPTVFYGCLLAIAVHKSLGSKPDRVNEVIDHQINIRLTPLTLADKSPGFASLAQIARQAAATKRDFLVKFPRVGHVGYESVLLPGPSKVLEGPPRERCDSIFATIAPSGVPQSGQFSVQWDAGGKVRAFPGFAPDRECTGPGKGVAASVMNHLNNELAAMRAQEQNAAAYDAVVQNIKICIATLRDLRAK